MTKKAAGKKTTKKTATKTKTKTRAKKKVEAASTTGKVKKAPKKIRVRMAGKSCSIASCKRPYRAKGYCRLHYKQWRHGSFGKVRYTACKDINCFKPQGQNRHGYCEQHFQNYYVKGMEAPKVEHAEAPEKKEEAA